MSNFPEPTEAERTIHDAFVKALADEGKLIEAGFAIMRQEMMADCSPAQVDELRVAYMCGAQHLFASLMAAMDTGSDLTPADFRRISLIDAELRAFQEEMHLRSAQTGGSA